MKRRDFLITSAGVSAGSVLAPLAFGQARPCPPSTLSVEGGTSTSTACVAAGDAEADWRLRSGQTAASPQPGVVWFHDFRSDAEVNAFRWTGGYSGGNDPRAVGSSVAPLTRRLAGGGVGGGDCLEILRRAGTTENSHWWRPLSALVGTGNGRGANDPGAGSLTPQPYAATDGGSQIYEWGRKGYYGHSSYHTGDQFDGTEYYLQMRVKMDPRRTTAGNSLVGKLTFHTTTRWSLTVQEIVTYSGANVGSVGMPNYFRMYGGGNSNPLEDKNVGPNNTQPGSELGVCDLSSPSKCWAWSGGWDTIMYHIVPGRAGVAESRIQVYAAHEGKTSYTKIWDELWSNFYESAGDLTANGYNALILSSYQNGLNNSEFWHRYTQLIFSKQFIPCPQV